MALVALLAGVSAVAPPNGAGRLSDSAFRLREQSSLAAANPRDGQSVAELLTWEQWLVQFGKSYDDDAEHARRRAVFEINLAHVHAHNTQADAGAHTFRAGVNAFTDLSSEEFLAAYTSPRQYSQYTQRTTRAGGTNSSAKAATGGQSPFDAVVPPPASMDWRKNGAVTPIKNQGSCGACWAFSAVASIEGRYQIATGALRSLSEQQLIDCSVEMGNQGCKGGNIVQAYEYVQLNKGIDSEADYPYIAKDFDPCWQQAAKRDVATISNWTSLPNGSEPALVTAASTGPVAVAIDAHDAIFQHYKSGTLSGTCGTSLNHGVTVVGYTPTTYIVKNSWGTTWGMQGYIEMARNVPPLGQCGIASLAQYPSVPTGSPLPIPPRTANNTRPKLPCNCELSCSHTCKAIGMSCCDGTGGNCNCAPASSCPKCQQTVLPYGRCVQSCAPNSIDAGCTSTAGMPVCLDLRHASLSLSLLSLRVRV